MCGYGEITGKPCEECQCGKKPKPAYMAIEEQVRSQSRFALTPYKKRPIQKNNTSGIEGVVWNKNAQKWSASASIDGKKTYLGIYTDKELASKAVQLKENLN